MEGSSAPAGRLADAVRKDGAFLQNEPSSDHSNGRPNLIRAKDSQRQVNRRRGPEALASESGQEENAALENATQSLAGAAEPIAPLSQALCLY